MVLGLGEGCGGQSCQARVKGEGQRGDIKRQQISCNVLIHAESAELANHRAGKADALHDVVLGISANPEVKVKAFVRPENKLCATWKYVHFVERQVTIIIFPPTYIYQD